MPLRNQLAGRLPADILPLVPNHFEVIGDIAIISLPAGLEPYGKIIAETVASGRKNIVTVLLRTARITGTERTARYEVLLGGTTVTVHREFGFAYRIDVGRSFFSARMAYERKRVTDQAEPGERVYVPFAGVGPFAIPAAARGADVVAVELNPAALRYLAENIGLNKVVTHCRALQGDALDPGILPRDRFDRIIIPAPYGMDRAAERLLPLVDEGGMAHLYTFRPKEEMPDLLATFGGRGFTVTYSAPCGNVAPGISRWVIDLARPL